MSTMKRSAVIAIITAVILSVVFFDQILIFLLSGSIPGLDVTLPPTTMLAVMVASTILVFALRRRHIVYQRCLTLYDELFGIKKKNKAAATGTKSALPRRRYQEL